MNFDTWWDTTKGTATPETYKGWEESCRQAWNAARESQNESLRATLKVAVGALAYCERRMDYLEDALALWRVPLRDAILRIKAVQR